MKESNKLSTWYSWPVIILALIIFWPVGVYLIIKRVSLDKKTAMSSGKVIGGFGIASYCLAVIFLLDCFIETFSGENIGYALFFGVAGYVLRRIAKKLAKDADDVKNYLSIIVNGNVRQLDAISAACDKPYDTVRADVQKMIDKGYLKNAYINEGTREIVLPAPQTDAQSFQMAGTSSAASAPRIVTCSCCGANNTLTRETGECEYCGAPIK